MWNAITCYKKDCSNQSRLNKNISNHKIPGQERKDISDAWIRTITRQVFPKAVDVCSDHFTENSCDESQELKQRLFSGNLKYILKPDVVPSLFPNWKAVNKSGSGSIHLFICSKLSGNKNIYDWVHILDSCKLQDSTQIPVK